nr:unnamed protein product [Spirometra erinaceieuropaei]
MRDTVQPTTLTLLVRARRQHQGWFGDNDTVISNLHVEKNCLHKTYFTRPTDDNNAAFYLSRRLAQQRLREMQDAWMARRAEEMQGYADLNEWKIFFSAIKAVYGPPTEATEPLLGADDSILFTKKTLFLRQDVFNNLSAVSNAAIAHLPQVDTNIDLDLLPSLYETIRLYNNSLARKRPDHKRSHPRFTSTLAPSSWII